MRRSRASHEGLPNQVGGALARAMKIRRTKLMRPVRERRRIAEPSWWGARARATKDRRTKLAGARARAMKDRRTKLVGRPCASDEESPNQRVRRWCAGEAMCASPFR